MGQDHLATRMAEALVTMLILSGPPLAAAVVIGVVVGFLQAVTQIQDQTLPQAVKLDTSGNLLLRGAHGPIGFGFDIAVGLKGLFPLRPWPFEGGFAPVPPSWGHVEAILSSQHHRFML